jgi:hypothetical protein
LRPHRARRPPGAARGLVAIVALVASAACGQPGPPPATQAPLAGAVARVGSVDLPAGLISDVAGANGWSSREALDALVDDALASQAAQAGGLDRAPGVSWWLTSALARRVPQRIAVEASEGPPTRDELSRVSVVHAVVMRSPTLREEDAIAVASAMRQAVVAAHDADDFIARAQAMAHPHAQVVAQKLEPFGPDGRDPGGGELDPGFVAAAFALHSPLEVSPIIASPFGWHVIQLLQRTELENPPADIVAVVSRMRARARLDSLLRARRAAERVEIAVTADERMAQAASAR